MSVKTIAKDCFVENGSKIIENTGNLDAGELKKNTIAYGILEKHNVSKTMDKLNIKFDAMASHDITYVGIIQTARASGLKEFPIPYILTNCHNSLSAVGGTINEDDHAFGLSAAVKYGGIYVPPHQAVIHQYMREMWAGGGRMILGSDSHTRYGALGTMAVGEGGPELVKQLLGRTWDISYPGVIGVLLTGKPRRGVGPQDVALAIIKEVFKNGFVKNKVMEFIGPGIDSLSVEYRSGIDVMTTETTCLSSIWKTDDTVKAYLKLHGREADYAELKPGKTAYYDGLIEVDLSRVEPMIALPFHPSNVYTINDFIANASEIMNKIDSEAKETFGNPNLDTGLPSRVVDGRVEVSQGVIAGCSGGSFENICEAADILDGKSIGDEHFGLSVYPASQPIYLETMKSGVAQKLMAAGALMRSAFCGPCFGAGDVPANKDFSIRHTTRNFPNREGSKPGEGQIASVALMDARSIAATSVNKGVLTPATELDYSISRAAYSFNGEIYQNRVKSRALSPSPSNDLVLGPNIKDWPEMVPLTENVLLKFTAVIDDPVTTTDELIPSGETSSFRSNPLRLAEFTLSRRVPEYVERSKTAYTAEKERRKGNISGEYEEVLKTVNTKAAACDGSNTGTGSILFANKPGDGSAREQAASCQKVLGGWANLALEYATKRYRSNCINWGILPFTIDKAEVDFEVGEYLFVPGVKTALENKQEELKAWVVNGDTLREKKVYLKDLTDAERKIILSGCLINYYAENK